MRAVLACSGRLARVAALLCAAMAVSSCAIDGPYARVNPFDADADISLSLAGPDSVHASSTTFTVTIESDVPLPPGPLAVTWTSSSPPLVTAIGGGQYRTGVLSSQYQQVQILAYFGDRVISTTVYVGQRP